MPDHFKIFREVLFWVQPGEIFKILYEMCLVIKPAFISNSSETFEFFVLDKLQDILEPYYPCEQFWG